MKIGLLTFHSQLNYGGVLQCWALQTALNKLGHEVVVVDRWHDADNSLLEQGYNNYSLKQWTKFWIRSLLGLGDMNYWLRHLRTKRFIKKYLYLTPYHFVGWKDAPKDLGVDLLVVGSDQVWHCGDWGDPTAYLLEGAPSIPAIAYAASFGIIKLPHGFSELYKRGLARFRAISCREREGVEICSNLGFDAKHVVDPTLLAYNENAEYRSKQDRVLICYFLSEKIDDYFDTLYAFARNHDCKVKVFMDSAWLEAVPKSMKQVKKMLRTWRRRLSSHVEIMDGAGPSEFNQAFKSAKWVISDSFHALMFSICNGCDPRIIKPSSPLRQNMFARIEEFAANTQGTLIVNSVQEALESFAEGEKVSFNYDWLSSRRDTSRSWLTSAITAHNLTTDH